METDIKIWYTYMYYLYMFHYLAALITFLQRPTDNIKLEAFAVGHANIFLISQYRDSVYLRTTGDFRFIS